MIPAATDHIIGHLIAQGFLNEERFAKSFARGKFNLKKWGRTRIIRELRNRDISRYNINTALKEIDETAYIETFDILSEKKWASIEMESNPQKKKRKLADYLLYRGWGKQFGLFQN